MHSVVYNTPGASILAVSSNLAIAEMLAKTALGASGVGKDTTKIITSDDYLYITSNSPFAPAAAGAAFAVLAVSAVALMATWSATPEGQAALAQMSTAIGQTVNDIETYFAEVANARATAIAYVNSMLQNLNKTHNYSGNSVYVLVDHMNVVHYVGRTNDPDRRDREHKSLLSNKKHYKMEVVMTGLSKNEARAAEQILISAYSLEALDNARREIAAANVVKFTDEVGRALGLMSGDSRLSTNIEDLTDWLKLR